MSKITLPTVTNGNNISTLNNNFSKIADALNNSVLYRQNPSTEPNQMLNLLDANGQRIINLPTPVDPNEAARLQDVQNAIQGLSVANLIQSAQYRWNTGTNVQAALNTIVDHVTTTDETLLITAFMFGAVGDGVADDTQALQAAINASTSAFFLPAGKTFRITNTLHVNNNKVYLYGQKSTILLDDPTGLLPHIQVGTNGPQVNQVEIRDIVFTRQQAATDGAAIHVFNGGIVDITNVYIYGNSKIYRGVYFNQAVGCSVKDSYITGCVKAGVDMLGTNTTDRRVVDVRVDRNRIDYCATGVNAGDYCEGLFVRNNIIYACPTAGFAYGAGSFGRYSIKLQNNDFDTCGIGVYMTKGSAFQIMGNWFSNNTQQNIMLQAGADTGVIGNNLLFGNATYASIEVWSNYVQIVGNNNSGGQAGVRVQAGATQIGIVGNSIGNCSYAVDISANPTYVDVLSNKLYNNSGGTVAGTGGTGCTVVNNSGFNPPGNSYIAVGASPFTYTAGFSPEYINITGGTVSQVTSGGVNTSFQTNTGLLLAPGQSVSITYSSKPTMTKIIQ